MTDAREQALAGWELVVGLEVHAQLDTRTKLFCGCALEFGGAPNSRTCPTCLGLPGALPRLNGRALEAALGVALALGCEVPAVTFLDRKNYSYPDLPKNYQISQKHACLGTGGALELLRSGRRVSVVDVHLEEDAGKLVHGRDAAGAPCSLVDLNRAGTPLCELVLGPDLRSVDEVDDACETIAAVLVALGASRARMEEGNLRFEASVSVRRAGEAGLNPRTEIKNLNSYAAVRRAVTWEQARQVALLEAGGRTRAETRLWDDEGRLPYEQGVPDALRPPEARVRALLPAGWTGGRTQFMRSKEDAHDYRYFPEPDLPPVLLPADLVEAARAALPEAPGARRRRYAEVLGVPQRQAEDLTRDRPLAAWFEGLVAEGVPAPEAANLTLNQLAAWLKGRGLDAAACPVPPRRVARLHALVAAGALPRDLVWKQVWPRVADDDLDPDEVIRREGLTPVDAGALDAAVDAAFAANEAAVRDLLAGKQKARGALVGAVMKATKGRAEPGQVNARIDARIAQKRAEAGG